MNRMRRSRRLYARSVLRARRAGFLTPEERRREFGGLVELPPQVGEFTHLWVEPLGGGEAVCLEGLLRLELTPQVEFPRRVRRRRRFRSAGPLPGAGRMTGGALRVEAAMPSGAPWPEFLESMTPGPAVRLEAWAPLSDGEGRWMVFTVPRVADVVWGPRDIEVTADWITFGLLSGLAHGARPGGSQWSLGVKESRPVLVA